MKYKVGDKVRIKSLDWYHKNKNASGNVYCGFKLFTEEMSKYCGKTMTITNVTSLNVIRMDRDSHYWTEEMIEGKVEGIENSLNSLNNFPSFDDEEVEVISNHKDKPDYWEKLKHQYAGMAMQGMLTYQGSEYLYDIPQKAIDIATALIKKLKEE